MRLVLFLLLLACSEAWGQSCTTTLNAGANVGTSISGATAGDVICLNNGNYSGFTASGVTKSPRVTVRAVNSRQASFTSDVSFTNSTSGLTITGVNMNASVYFTGANTSNITVADFNSTGDITFENITISTTNILVDNFSQINFDLCSARTNGAHPCVDTEAGVNFYQASPSRSTPIATIRRAIIDGGCADGFRFDGPGIVEYSYIANKVVGSCSGDPHVDAAQFFGGPYDGSIVRGNYWYSNVQVLAHFAYDISGVLIEHNVFDPGPSGERRPCQIEWYSDSGSTIQHNTLLYRDSSYPGDICLDVRGDDPSPGSGTIVRNNIANSVSTNNGATTTVNTNNLLRAGGGASNTTGSPTFEGTCTGGSANWRNCALTNGSLGRSGATDGRDIGVNYYGVGAPTGLKFE